MMMAARVLNCNVRHLVVEWVWSACLVPRCLSWLMGLIPCSVDACGVVIPLPPSPPPRPPLPNPALPPPPHTPNPHLRFMKTGIVMTGMSPSINRTWNFQHASLRAHPSLPGGIEVSIMSTTASVRSVHLWCLVVVVFPGGFRQGVPVYDVSCIKAPLKELCATAHRDRV